MRKYDICYSCQADKDLDDLFEVIVFEYGVPKTAFKYVQGIIETIENLFYGKSVVFTGTLTSIQRKDAMQIIADVGGIPENGITLKTNFLVVGQQNFNVVGKGGLSSKQKKALQLLEILSNNAIFVLTVIFIIWSIIRIISISVIAQKPFFDELIYFGLV